MKTIFSILFFVISAHANEKCYPKLLPKIEFEPEAFELIDCARPNLAITLKNGKMISAKQLFSKPIAFGASVSAGFNSSQNEYGELIPTAERLTKRFNPKAELLNRAKSFTSSLEFEKTYFAKGVPKEFEKSSAVIALDLFYWDANTQRKNPDCKVDHIKRLIQTFAPRPAFLGEVPVLSTGNQNEECRKKINQTIFTECSAQVNCHVVSLKGLVLDPKVDLQSDNLHFTNSGYARLENHFCKEMLSSSQSK